VVEQLGLWSLAGDLEHVLEHRDARDQQVFEAASWALAANRLQRERRRQLWQEALPAVELADRLRHVPLFDFTHINELFLLATMGRQVRYEKDQELFEAGAPVRALQFLLDGVVTVARPSGPHTVAAPAALGFEELLEGSPMPCAVTAAERVVTLSLTADEFLALLAENVELAEGLFRMMIASHGLATGHTRVKGSLPPEARQRAAGELNAIDRLIVLQSSPLLAQATSAQLWRLSAIARPVTLAAGREALRQDGEPAILIVLSGELQVAPATGEALTADAGDVIGMYETLAGTPIDAAVTATSPVQALKLDRDALFELLADHTDLLQGVFGMLSRRRTA